MMQFISFLVLGKLYKALFHFWTLTSFNQSLIQSVIKLHHLFYKKVIIMQKSIIIEKSISTILWGSSKDITDRYYC